MNMRLFIEPWPKNNFCVGGTTTKLMGQFTKKKDPLKFRSFFKLSQKDIIRVEQVHGNQVSIATKDQAGKIIPASDGLVTKERKFYLMVFTADCIPIFFYDYVNQIIGLIHAGKKGTFTNIARFTLEKMKQLGAKISSIKVHLGPHICGDCYEYNLALVNFLQLKQSGVSVKNITISPFCTFENQDYFCSYRRDKISEFNQMLSFIALK